MLVTLPWHMYDEHCTPSASCKATQGGPGRAARYGLWVKSEEQGKNPYLTCMAVMKRTHTRNEHDTSSDALGKWV